MFSKACRSAVSSYVPEPETATAAVTEALQTFDEARKEQVEGGSPVNASEALPKAVSALAPFATVSGSNVFLVIPLAARLLQVQRAATAVTEPLPGSVVPKHSATLRKNEDGGARGRDPQRRSTRNQQEKTWCWAASEVPDRLGDIAHCIACCYFLVYGQPVLRPTPPLDKLVLKTTKEQMRSNFVEGSLPAAVLGVYIHRAVQRCAPWATELPCRGKVRPPAVTSKHAHTVKNTKVFSCLYGDHREVVPTTRASTVVSLFSLSLSNPLDCLPC